MSRKSSKLFTSVPQQKAKRNHFDLSHEVKMSGKFGYLYPQLVMECLPGDTVRDTMSCFIRFAPMLAPVLHLIKVKTEAFFVPTRILLDSWEDFITGGQDGDLAPVLPYFTPQGIYTNAGNSNDRMRVGSLWDYMGLPTLLPATPAPYNVERISALPFRAYAKIWNDWYKDPNLDNDIAIGSELDGDVNAAQSAALLNSIKRRGFEKDFFTSQLPFAQRGAEVLMPLAGSGTVTYREPAEMYKTGGAVVADVGDVKAGGFGFLQDVNSNNLRMENIDSVQMTSSSVSINDFRVAIAIQGWLENNARGGARYNEQIQAHWDTTVPDYRLQRAEFVGSGRQKVIISEVLSTTENEDAVVGEMKGHGISVGKSNYFSYTAREHGYVIFLISVVPATSYSQGLERMWTREDKFDYAWRELANLGEQETLSKEVFYSFDDADTAANNAIFGYIPRYSEYKYKNDRIAGDFKTTLGFWTLTRNFTTRPSLDITFTTMYEDGDDVEETFRRIFAVTDGTDYLWMQLFHNLTVQRSLPYFGVPKTL